MHNFPKVDDIGCIASVSKEWFTFGDAYKTAVADGGTPEIVLAVALVIDECLKHLFFTKNGGKL